MSVAAGKGPRRFWLRQVIPLVEGEATTPFTQVALLADLTNPVANSGSAGVGFVNADITLYLHRQPAGEWYCLEVVSHESAAGIAVGEAALFDRDGPIGRSIVSGVANRRPGA